MRGLLCFPTPIITLVMSTPNKVRWGHHIMSFCIIMECSLPKAECNQLGDANAKANQIKVQEKNKTAKIIALVFCDRGCSG